MPPSAVFVDDWRTLRRSTRPGALRALLGSCMAEEGLLKDAELFQDAFEYAAAFHRSMTERDLREHTVEQVLSLAMYTLGEAVPPTDEALRRAAKKALEQNAAQVAWYDDALPFLESLKDRRTPVALVSNTIFGLGSLWEERLSQWFSVRVLSREFGYVKPHPGIFLEAARELRVDPKDGAFVGDLLLSDVWGAQRVGMRAILLDRRDQEQDAFRASDARLAAHLGVDVSAVRPDAVVSSLDDVLSVLA